MAAINLDPARTRWPPARSRSWTRRCGHIFSSRAAKEDGHERHVRWSPAVLLAGQVQDPGMPHSLDNARTVQLHGNAGLGAQRTDTIPVGGAGRASPAASKQEGLREQSPPENASATG